MNNTSSNKNNLKTLVKFIIPSVLLFACTLLFMPEMGVLRTLPFFAVGGMAAFFFGMTVKTAVAMSFVMTLCMYLLSGKEVVFSIGFSAVAAIVCALGVYVVNLVQIAAKTQKTKLKNKCIVFSAISILLIVLVCAVTCGNPISYLSAKGGNEEYINTYYNGKVEIKYTRYAPLSGEYRTYVKFNKDGYAYGVDDDCYVSENHDGIREVFAKDILERASMLLSKIAASSDGGFYVVGADLEFEENEVKLNTDNSIGYLSRISYVLSFDGLLDRGDRDRFSELCKKTLSKIEQEGFVFDTIVFCGGDASDVYFSVTVNGDDDFADTSALVKNFDENSILPFDVTKQDVLAYWQNN